MKNGKNINVLDLYFRRKNIKNKTTDKLILKNPLSPKTKSKFVLPYPSRNIKINESKKEYEENKNNINNNKEKDKKSQMKKYKKILLPSLSTNLSSYKSVINSEMKNSWRNKPKLLKIKKIVNLSPVTDKRNNKKLIELYKENFIKKRKMEKYKEMKKNNIRYFSFEDYNEHLLKYSSINLSEDNYNIFKKNMICIQKAFNGRNTLSNKFKKLFENKNNILSLSENREHKKVKFD